MTGLAPERQADFDRFERIQRAKVLSSEVEDPPGLAGTTVFGHLAQDLGSWSDYGDLRWDGNGCGTLSANHYDWSYGMYLQLLRTGELAFADAARVFARHEIDLDVYHTALDGPAFSFQKQWEDRPSHDSPDNCFGGGRPTHTWVQGYVLHWLLTADPRGRDAALELLEGIRLYLYESFNGEGHPNTAEIRLNGWLVDNLVALYRMLGPSTLPTSSYGAKTIPQAIQDVLAPVAARLVGDADSASVPDALPGTDDPDPNARSGLQHLYFIEPVIKAHEEVFLPSDPTYATYLWDTFIRRVTRYLTSITYGGDSGAGGYRPRQLPYRYVLDQPLESQGQGTIVYLLMSANAAAYGHLVAGDESLRTYARSAFQDYVRYGLIAPGDAYVDPALRSPASYASSLFRGTESKIHGWGSRYGQYVLAMENAGGTCAVDSTPPQVTPPSPSTVYVRQTTCAGGMGATLEGLAVRGPTDRAALLALLEGGSASDACSAATRLPPRLDGTDVTPSTRFPVGTSPVQLRFQDAAGNVGTSEVRVIVDRHGDLDRSGVVDVADSVLLANHLVGNLPASVAPFLTPADRGEANDDGSLDVFDLVLLLGHIVGNVPCLTP